MKKNPAKVAIVALAAAAVSLSLVTSSSSAATTLYISSDLPKQGGSADQSESTNKAIKLLLKQRNNKAGKFTIKFREYDNSTAAKGKWDDAQCAKNAQAHVAARDEVAVIGTYNSGCAKIIVPVLNQDPKGPMVMVSNANTNVGLTKPYEAGEPGKYYPTGKRNYYRVVTHDNNQGAGAAAFAKKIGIKSVYVLNDRETYGQGIAESFTRNAKKLGITILSDGPAGEGWDAKATSYEAVFTKIKALKPDMVYLGGIYDNNGGLLVKDKVRYLGTNSAVKMMMADGFTGYPDFDNSDDAQGSYVSFTGLTLDQMPKDGAAGNFQDEYILTYGDLPVGAFSVYGAAAAQVVLDAISRSNGTRKSIFEKMKTVDIPANKSVVGTRLKFDKDGDILAKDITITVVKNKEQVFFDKFQIKD